MDRPSVDSLADKANRPAAVPELEQIRADPNQFSIFGGARTWSALSGCGAPRWCDGVEIRAELLGGSCAACSALSPSSRRRSIASSKVNSDPSLLYGPRPRPHAREGQQRVSYRRAYELTFL